MIKLGNKESKAPRELVEIYPNPTSDYVNLLIQQEFEPSKGAVYTLAGQKIVKFSIFKLIKRINIKKGIYQTR
ncbi:T9SS type A sorting domain-containing protein [Empedobacter brevis]